MHYNVIKSESIYEETEKRSKFISYSFKVFSESEAEKKLSEVKALHHSAKHHVYGYVLENSEKSSDDGEPSGTGGVPIMTAIKSFNLKNVLVVVVRYFGGILLGTGGLRRMYSSGAVGVLEMSGSVKMSFCSEISVSCDYKQIGQISNCILNFGGKILKTDYAGEVKIRFCIPCGSEADILSKLEGILRCKNKTSIISKGYYEL